jgi:hypothetical protein
MNLRRCSSFYSRLLFELLCEYDAIVCDAQNSLSLSIELQKFDEILFRSLIMTCVQSRSAISCKRFHSSFILLFSNFIVVRWSNWYSLMTCSMHTHTNTIIIIDNESNMFWVHWCIAILSFLVFQNVNIKSLMMSSTQKRAFDDLTFDWQLKLI